jgi:hypothetical protein
MRSGFLTSAAKGGASIFKMVVDQSRHRPVKTLRGYVRDAQIFKSTRAPACCDRRDDKVLFGDVGHGLRPECHYAHGS